MPSKPRMGMTGGCWRTERRRRTWICVREEKGTSISRLDYVVLGKTKRLTQKKLRKTIKYEKK
jgi:hypothetical protein